MKTIISLVLLTFLTTVSNAQKSDCCDTLLKLINGKQVHKTTCVKRPTKTPNQDIIISIDNSHSANNTTERIPKTNLNPCPDRKITDPENIWMLILTSLFGLLALYIRVRIKNLAKLSDIGKITDKIESIKHEYNNKIEEYKAKLGEELAIKVEPLKAMLQKENISYQIGLAELTKARFDRIDTLYIDLINLQKYISTNMFFYNDDSDFQSKISEFKKFYDIADMSRHKCSLYITDELKKKIIDVLNGCFAAYSAFRGLYNSDTRKLGEISIFNIAKQELLQKLAAQNNYHLQKLDENIDKFPELLESLEKEFKQQIIFKEI